MLCYEDVERSVVCVMCVYTGVYFDCFPWCLMMAPTTSSF